MWIKECVLGFISHRARQQQQQQQKNKKQIRKGSKKTWKTIIKEHKTVLIICNDYLFIVHICQRYVVTVTVRRPFVSFKQTNDRNKRQTYFANKQKKKCSVNLLLKLFLGDLNAFDIAR